MNKKQIVGLIVAGFMFVFVSAAGIFTNYLNKQLNEQSKKDVLSILMDSGKSYDLPIDPYIGVVRVEGVIQDTEVSMFDDSSYNHKGTIDYVDAMIKSSSNKGIMLYVNSPGGGVYESDELYLKLMEYKEKTNRPVWTYMGSQACSGGYYISMASDKIIANRNCWTGSIGVIISLVNYKGLLDKLGVAEIDITSGKNKAMGSAAADMTTEQRAILQSLVDEAYDQFVGIVAEGRTLELEQVKTVADGRIYTAKQALELKLIDGIESYEKTTDLMMDEVGSGVQLYEPEVATNKLFTSLFSTFKGVKTKSDAQVVTEYIENKRNGVLMYYAEPGTN